MGSEEESAARILSRAWPACRAIANRRNVQICSLPLACISQPAETAKRNLEQRGPAGLTLLVRRLWRISPTPPPLCSRTIDALCGVPPTNQNEAFQHMESLAESTLMVAALLIVLPLLFVNSEITLISFFGERRLARYYQIIYIATFHYIASTPSGLLVSKRMVSTSPNRGE